MVAGGNDWYMLSSRTDKDTWNKIKKYFKYYREPSDDLDLSVIHIKNVWVTQDINEVEALLKKDL